jgi:hypothetical protein
MRICYLRIESKWNFNALGFRSVRIVFPAAHRSEENALLEKGISGVGGADYRA